MTVDRFVGSTIANNHSSLIGISFIGTKACDYPSKRPRNASKNHFQNSSIKTSKCIQENTLNDAMKLGQNLSTKRNNQKDDCDMEATRNQVIHSKYTG